MEEMSRMRRQMTAIETIREFCRVWFEAVSYTHLVLMIRESDDVQLDNIARTVIANNTSDCHIALHWDSTTNNKGAFYMSVPSNQSYRNMEPVRCV